MKPDLQNSVDPIILETISVGPIETNCYLVGDATTKEVLLIDPGDEPDRIETVVSRNQYKIVAIIATHGHLDHIGAAQWFQERYKLPFHIHKEDESLIKILPLQNSIFGFYFSGIPVIDSYLEHGQLLTAGKISLKVVHTPGHSPGSVGLVFGNRLISGDTLFAGSIGRHDLFGGNGNQLIHSIKTRFLVLDDAMAVYPGHGPSTTIGHEKKHNYLIR